MIIKNCNRIFPVSVIAISLLVAGCAKDITTDTYDEASVGQVNRVIKGTIIEIRHVKVKGHSGVGDMAGGAAGAVVGSNLGGGKGSLIGVIAGAVAGGVIGNKLDEKMNTQLAQEIFVKTNDGRAISVVEVNPNLQVGQHVLVIYGAESKIIPDNSLG